jgi:hypothetical protein
MRSTPEQHPEAAWLAKKIGQADEFARKPFGYDNPPAAAISSLFGVPAIQRTLERFGYGEPLTNAGKANVPFLSEDTGEALMAAPQFISPMAKVAQLTKGMPVGAIIRNTGDNNFLKGSVENALAGLKKKGFTREEAIQKRTERLIARGTPEKNRIPGMDTYGDPISDQALTLEMEVNHRLPPRLNPQLLTTADVASNKFVEGPLTRYVKQQMATPDDPVRALAEQGVLHFQPNSPMAADLASLQRSILKMPAEGKLDLAKVWENNADIAIHPAGTAKQILDDASTRLGSILGKAAWVKDNSWLATKPPETNVFNTTPSMRDLGFTHLTDELRNALNPESGLPRNLLLTPEKMANMGMEKAVRHVAAINDWREQAALTARKAAAEGIPVRKEHEGGFRWLTVPDTAKDEKALKFACDIGKQGAWCTQGADMAKRYGSDGNQLHVLVDAKGDPHVQIMTTKGRTPRLDGFFEELPDDAVAAAKAAMPARDFQHAASVRSWIAKNWKGEIVPYPDTIVQIKRKANLVNSEPYEYRPFVQDFVKSGKWGDVEDYANTGLRHGPREFTPAALENLSARGIDATGHMTPEEYEAALAFVPESALSPQQLRKLKGFATGGLVYSPQRVDEIIAQHRNTEYDPARVDDLVAQLKEEMYV